MRHSGIGPLALGLLLTSQPSAQEPSFTPFGQGCGVGGFALPSLDGADGSLPTIGDRFTILFRDLPFRLSSTPGKVIVFLGFSNSNWRGIALPLDLGPHGAPSCTLYVSDNQVAMQDYAGHAARWSVDIPNDSSLLDLHFFTQGLVLEPQANFLGIVTTNAAEGVVGLNRGPEVSIVFPPPRSLTNKDSILVRGTANDRDGIAEVRVNGQLASTSDGYANWGLELPLTIGDNTLSVVTVDNLGLVNREAAQAQIESQARIQFPEAIAFDPVSNTALVANTDSIISIDLSTGNRRVLSDRNHGTGSHMSGLRGLTLDGSRLLVTAGSLTSRVVEVDLATGNRRLISEVLRGVGPSLISPRGIVRQGGEALVVVQGFDQPTSRNFGSIIAVDLLTGNRRLISDLNIGAGFRLIEPIGIALDGNRALITDATRNGIVTVDLLTGDRIFFSGGLVGTGPVFTHPLDIVVDGTRALVVDKTLAGLYAVDLSTGNRSVVSDGTKGSGPSLMTPWAITKTGNTALVLDRDLQAVFSIDLATGDRAVLSKSSIGSGPLLLDQTAVSLDQARLFVLDSASATILQIDRKTGDRRVVSDRDQGTGPFLFSPTAFALEGNRAYVVDDFRDAVLEVHLLTGARRVVSDDLVGSGEQLDSPVGIALFGMQAVVIDKGLREILNIDLLTGERRVVSGPLIGSGPPLSALVAIAVDGNRAIVLRGPSAPDFLTSILAVDLTTGDRTVLSDNQNGTGPSLRFAASLAIEGGRALLSNGWSILAVDLLTGDRSVVADVVQLVIDDLFPGTGIVVDGTQAILISKVLRYVTAVDLDTGEQVILSK